MVKKSWSLVVCAGLSLSEVRPCFAPNNRYLFVACGSDVIVIEVKSGILSKRLNHSDNVIAVTTNPKNADQLLTCTDNGILSIWDCISLNKENTFDFELYYVSSLFVLDSFCFIVGAPKSNDSLVNAYKFLFPQDDEKIHLERQLKDVPRTEKKIAFCESYLVYVKDENLFLHNFDKKSTSKYYLTNDRLFTCVSCHIEMDAIAAGDSTGRIFVWTNVSSLEKIKEFSQVLHWHTMPVTDICWSFQGSSLISGAAEAVLVKYTLHTQSKATRQFLPRLGAPIATIFQSSDGVLVGAVLEDNTIQVSENHVENRSIVFDLIRSRIRPSLGIVCDLTGSTGLHSQGAIITNARTGHIQYFSPIDKQLLFQFDVAGQNMPLAERDRVLTWSEVVLVATAADWLVTVECRSDTIETHEQELLMKFWHFDSKMNRFELNTCVEYPHIGVVNDIRFQPNSINDLCLVSVSSDGKMKMWYIDDEPSIYGVNSFWYCGGIESFQNLPAHCCAFSHCGAVLAIGFGSMLTLWEMKGKSGVLASLSPYSTQCDIRQIVWCGGYETHLIVCRTDSNIICLNLETLSAVWIVPQNVLYLTQDPTSQLVCALSSSQICLFHPSNPDPLVLIDLKEELKYYTAAFVPQFPISEFVIKTKEDLKHLSSTLYLMSPDQELVRLDSPYELPVRTKRSRRTSSQSEAITPFAKVLQEEKIEKSVEETKRFERDHRSNIALLSGPTHTLPPLEVLATSFINSCILKKTK